tara:strand:+ start:1970 stop:2515 length:546 start_codon:yes stop_codon:yes gene_type:complete
MTNINQLTNLTDGFFLLFLAVSGNFIAETMGCQVQYYFTNNIFIKNIILLLLIYFSINFTQKQNDNISPFSHILYTFILWAFFIIFSKLSIKYVYILIIILFLLLVIRKQKDYEYKKTDNNSEKDKSNNKYTNIENALLILLITVLTFGFINYLIIKKKEFKSKFNIFKFLFDNTKCDRIK